MFSVDFPLLYESLNSSDEVLRFPQMATIVILFIEHTTVREPWR